MMRWQRTVLWLLFLVGPVAASAQTLRELRSVGPRANNINLVLLAEGYTTAEEEKFVKDADGQLLRLLADDSWSGVAAYVNAYAIFVPSAESGTDDPSRGVTRDTYFNSSFGSSGVQRLLAIPPYAPGNANPADGVGKVNHLLQQFAPDYDVVILLVNSTTYGGSGGFPAITSLHADSHEILSHELGHSFAHLTDEYVDDAVAPQYPPAEFPNATQISVREEIPWRAFVSPATPIPTASAPHENVVGLFQGSHFRSSGFYRPTFNSRMRSLGRPWGPVNLRAFTSELHRLDLNRATEMPSVVRQPVGAVVPVGQSYLLSAEAAGTGPLTYQWKHNGVYIPDAVSPELLVAAVTAGTSGTYAVEVTNAVGTVSSEDVIVANPGAALPPSITSDPLPVHARIGSVLVLTVSARDAMTYQWFRDGVLIPGATAESLVIDQIGLAQAGSYSVEVRNAHGVVLSKPAVVTVSAAEPSRIINLSVRTHLAARQIIIIGFVSTGEKTMLVRAAGPSLITVAPDLAGELHPDPSLALFENQTPVISNDDWEESLAPVFAQVGAFPFVSGARDAALRQTIMGARTVHASGPDSGIVLVEAYDSGGSGRLVNVAARNRVATGANVLIAGFVLHGATAKTVLIRGVGPKLADIGVPDVLSDPKLELYDHKSRKIAENDDWNSDLEHLALRAGAGGLPLPTGGKDAALVITLNPGLYSAVVSGVGDTVGEALVEIYEVP